MAATLNLLESVLVSPTPAPTLADVFKDFWSPSFAASYLNKGVIQQIPGNQMPSAENGYSVSNFIIEYVMSIHNKFGMKEAEKVVTELLADVPTIESARLKCRVMKRVEQLAIKKRIQPLCSFCRNNGLPPELYMNHILKDYLGRVACPILRQYTCPKCGANGDDAHTMNYCPYKITGLISPPRSRLHSCTSI
ncbi:NANOS1 [Bugula neritina]|uniref:NANOS1 n=1 Tax=Bugula neritina TaxID=10212 RepID=A0A7J7KPM9_BUGNE|nr:NANOS1 [Bugula neritina]